MISYEPFFKTLEKNKKTLYALNKKDGISRNTIFRMQQGKPITTETIDKLCGILKCEISDIIELKKD